MERPELRHLGRTPRHRVDSPPRMAAIPTNMAARRHRVMVWIGPMLCFYWICVTWIFSVRNRSLIRRRTPQSYQFKVGGRCSTCSCFSTAMGS